MLDGVLQLEKLIMASFFAKTPAEEGLFRLSF